MPAIFISYRRSDSQDVAGRIYDRLLLHFQRRVHIVRDVDSFPVGEDFRDVLRDKIQQCEVVLVVIGPSWINVTDSKGNRRLSDTADTVRIEVEQALALGKKVIPICVTHADMPTAEDLPESIQKLAFRNGVQVRPDPDFHPDVGRLIGAIEKILQGLPSGLSAHQASPARQAPPFHQAPPSHQASSAHAPQSPPVQQSASTPSPPSPPPPKPQPAHAPHPAPPKPAYAATAPPAPPPHISGPQPQARSLPPAGGGLSKGLIASGTGVLAVLGGLVVLCFCGGYGIYFLAMLGSQGYASDLRADLKNHPAILEHIGEIQTIEQEWGTVGLPPAPDGSSSMLFKMTGSKGTAEIVGHTDRSSGNYRMIGDTLRLTDGTQIPLQSMLPPSPEKVAPE